MAHSRKGARQVMPLAAGAMQASHKAGFWGPQSSAVCNMPRVRSGTADEGRSSGCQWQGFSAIVGTGLRTNEKGCKKNEHGQPGHGDEGRADALGSDPDGGC